MEIQQKEKESLAAYTHQFKREASRCKFNNDAATIRIFIKGLRECAHFGNKSLREETTKLNRCHQGSRETSSSTTINSYTYYPHPQ